MSNAKSKVVGKSTAGKTARISFEQPDAETLRVILEGTWTINAQLPPADGVEKRLAATEGVRRIGFKTDGISDWDSALLTFLLKVADVCSKRGIDFEKNGLPKGVARLIALATAVAERKGARKKNVRRPFLNRAGSAAIDWWHSIDETLAFIGETAIALLKFLAGKASFRRRDLALFIQQCGADALPIVTLISLLVGLILAFVGAVQLMMFGAQLYVANLVGISMVRVMGAVMAGIVMAGRTGAAFAAQLGTMQVNEEIDALKTMGISPMEFLVLPRMLALVLMMPLLCIYADLMGILGGLIVGVGMLDIGLIQYIHQTRASLNISFFLIGIIQAGIFGVLVALSGCLRGMQCGRSASAVGQATTSAVVTSIVAIIVATGLVTVVCNVLGI